MPSLSASPPGIWNATELTLDTIIEAPELPPTIETSSPTE